METGKWVRERESEGVGCYTLRTKTHYPNNKVSGWARAHTRAQLLAKKLPSSKFQCNKQNNQIFSQKKKQSNKVTDIRCCMLLLSSIKEKKNFSQIHFSTFVKVAFDSKKFITFEKLNYE